MYYRLGPFQAPAVHSFMSIALQGHLSKHLRLWILGEYLGHTNELGLIYCHHVLHYREYIFAFIMSRSWMSCSCICVQTKLHVVGGDRRIVNTWVIYHHPRDIQISIPGCLQIRQIRLFTVNLCLNLTSEFIGILASCQARRDYVKRL